jgi:CDP-diacylglycerol--glycerol-3-phosphate 3-phosphatidyltransferase
MLPNLITTLRIILAAAFAAVVAIGGRDVPEFAISVELAVALAVLAALEELTDTVDGRIARATGTASEFGGIYDPLIDSLSRLTVYFSMALAGWITIAVPLVMAGRDLIVAYTRIVNALTGGKTSARISGKAKAVVQCIGVFLVIFLAWIPNHVQDPTWQKLRVATAAVIILATAWSLFDYVRGTVPGIRTMLAKKPGT